MDDQEILNLMKMSGKKKRSRNCLISSTSLGKENFKLNQILGGENATVYALVEVSNDKEKPAKREKIPLNNKDLFRIMQKLMISQNVKPERKILKPSKRKHVVESARVAANISEEENTIQNDVLTYQKVGWADEIGVIYKRSNHSGVDKMADAQGDRNGQRLNSGDHNTSESESHDLKILFNRNNAGNQEPIVKQKGIGPVSRCTNTDIVQTPKVLEEALQLLSMNFDTERSDGKSDGSQSDKKSLRFNEFDLERNAYKSITSATQNFLFVPFIITNKQISTYQKSCSHHFTKPNYVSPETNEWKMNRSELSNHDLTQKFLTDQPTEQSEINSMNIDSKSESKVVHAIKNGTEVNETGKIQNKPKHHTALGVDGEVYLLKEVKTLQQRINAIVESLETGNFSCLNNFHNDKNREDSALHGIFNAQTNDHSWKPKSETKKPSDNVMQYLDCGVQAVVRKSFSHKTVSVPSGTVAKSLRNRFVQFPSEGKINFKPKPMKLVTCKSSPHFHSNFECQYVKIKRASSLVTFGRQIQEGKHISVGNFKFNGEGHMPDNYDSTGKDSEIELFKKRWKDEPHRSEKSTNILFRKNNMTFLAENGKDKLVTIKKCGKIAKIRIVGSTTLFNEIRDSEAGKIKLQLNELGSIKISNKFCKKIKTIDNNSNCNNSNNNLCDNSEIADSNISRSVKDEESNKKVFGKETVSKIMRREFLQKKVEDTKSTGSNPKTSAKDPDSQSISRVSKLKKPSTPVRMFARGTEDGLDSAKPPRIQSPKDQTVVRKTDENNSATFPRYAKSAEKVNEKKKVGSLIPKKQSPTPVGICRNGKPTVENVRESEVEKSRDEVLTKSIVQTSNADKQSPPVKSIWALTKVVLYEDGSQSVEVLEASSHPLKYQLNKTLGNNDGNESKIIIPTINNHCQNSISLEEKSH